MYADEGDAVCDYPCAGDDTMICGGYLTFTAYDIGETLIMLPHLIQMLRSGGGGGGEVCVWPAGVLSSSPYLSASTRDQCSSRHRYVQTVTSVLVNVNVRSF